MKRLSVCFAMLAVFIVLNGCVTLPTLHTAAHEGDINTVKRLLDQGSNVNEFYYGTPLTFAASKKGNADMVKLLLDRGANVNAGMSLFDITYTALGTAAESGDTEVMEILINKGADVEGTIRNLEKRAAWLAANNFHGQIPNVKRGISLLKEMPAAIANKAGWAHYEKGQYQEAITSFKKAISLNPSDSFNYRGLSASYNGLKQYDEAITAAKKAIDLKPDNAKAYNDLGVAYSGKKRFDEALNEYQKAIEIEPNVAQLYNNIGRLFIEKNDYRRAADAYKKASELDSANPWNYFSLANVYRLMGIYDDALASANKTIELQTIPDKTAAPAFGLRSLIYRYRGNKEEAMKDAEKAYSLDSAHDWSRVSLGAAYLDAGQYNESIKLLSQVKDSPLATVLEATAYARQGNVKEAGKSYLSIAEEEMSPKNIPLMEDRKALLKTFKPIVMEHRDKARSFESGGKYKEALAELTEAFKMADETEAEGIQETIFSIARRNPLLSEMSEESRKYALRGEVMIKEGNFEPAAAEFKKAIQTSPYVARLYYNSALINAELKKYPEAIRDMKTYLRAAPDAPDARAAKDEIIKWEYLMEKGKK